VPLLTGAAMKALLLSTTRFPARLESRNIVRQDKAGRGLRRHTLNSHHATVVRIIALNHQAAIGRAIGRGIRFRRPRCRGTGDNRQSASEANGNSKDGIHGKVWPASVGAGAQIRVARR
jgi:hypothetical protein